MTTLLQIVLNEVRGRVWGLMWLAVLFRDRHSHDTGHSVDYLVATEWCWGEDVWVWNVAYSRAESGRFDWIVDDAGSLWLLSNTLRSFSSTPNLLSSGTSLFHSWHIHWPAGILPALRTTCLLPVHFCDWKDRCDHEHVIHRIGCGCWHSPSRGGTNQVLYFIARESWSRLADLSPRRSAMLWIFTTM